MKSKSSIKKIRLQLSVATFIVATTISVAIFGLLSLQMASGKDPVLGEEKKPIIEKKLVVRKTVVNSNKKVVEKSQKVIPQEVVPQAVMPQEAPQAAPQYVEPQAPLAPVTSAPS